jgi:hypothetical protein
MVLHLLMVSGGLHCLMKTTYQDIMTRVLLVLKGYDEPNPNSSPQVKDWLFSLGWVPCTFKYEKEDDGTERTIPQVRKDGELTDSVNYCRRQSCSRSS